MDWDTTKETYNWLFDILVCLQNMMHQCGMKVVKDNERRGKGRKKKKKKKKGKMKRRRYFLMCLIGVITCWNFRDF